MVLKHRGILKFEKTILFYSRLNSSPFKIKRDFLSQIKSNNIIKLIRTVHRNLDREHEKFFPNPSIPQLNHNFEESHCGLAVNEVI